RWPRDWSSDVCSSDLGYGLGVAVDVLCGVLSGAGYSAALDPNGWSTGHFFAAIRIDAFRAVPMFKAMMDEMIRFLRAAPRVPGRSEERRVGKGGGGRG